MYIIKLKEILPANFKLYTQFDQQPQGISANLSVPYHIPFPKKYVMKKQL